MRRYFVRGVIPSIRRLRGLVPPGWRGAAAGALALMLPLTAVGIATAGSGHDAHPKAHPSPSTGPFPVTPADIAASLGDLRDLGSFDKVAKKPQAAAPIRKLPHVDLLKVNVGGIPPVAAGAYVRAARHLAATDPGCRLKWWLVAGIGFVESGHAASGGSHARGWNGIARPPIIGPVLDGSGGFAAIRDTDRGAYDGDRRWDRAVGPMQFLPSTWQTWGQSNGKLGNPESIVAAADATARYLCASGGNLGTPHGMALAVFSYNHSFDYVRLVMSVGAKYAGIDPATLGVNALPTDKQYKKHRHHQKARHHRKKAAATTSTSPSSTSTTSPKPATSPKPSPSPSASSSGGGGGVLPEPSPSQSTIPVPTLGPGLP